MKYKPYFCLQPFELQEDPYWKLDYFNGRFCVAMDSQMVTALMAANLRSGEQFNCVFTVQLSVPQQRLMLPALKSSSDGPMLALADQLENVPCVVPLRLNPGAAMMLVQTMRLHVRERLSILGLVFTMEMNWVGAEILAEICSADYEQVAKDFSKELKELMIDLKERKEQWEARQEEAPRGYMGNGK